MSGDIEFPPGSPTDWSTHESDHARDRLHSIRRIQVLDGDGTCLFDRTWLWELDVAVDRVASFVQTLKQFGREVEGGCKS